MSTSKEVIKERAYERGQTAATEGKQSKPPTPTLLDSKATTERKLDEREPYKQGYAEKKKEIEDAKDEVD